MSRLLTLLIMVVVIQTSSGAVPQPPVQDPPPMPEAGLPVGKWSIEFANGVTEVCEIRKDGTASVVEPLRTANGKATLRGGSVVITFEDDRIERWTPVGRKMVVEHWFPGSQLPTVTPVLGIAEIVR